jgi:uncharacterized membrane protein
MKISASVQGAAKSVTMWAAGILLAAGQLVPYVNADTLASMGIEGHTATRVLTICGLIMAACRVITNKSLADKAVPTPAVAAPTTQEPPK